MNKTIRNILIAVMLVACPGTGLIARPVKYVVEGWEDTNGDGCTPSYYPVTYSFEINDETSQVLNVCYSYYGITICADLTEEHMGDPIFLERDSDPTGAGHKGEAERWLVRSNTGDDHFFGVSIDLFAGPAVEAPDAVFGIYGSSTSFGVNRGPECPEHWVSSCYALSIRRVRTDVPGDSDKDGDADLRDFAAFQNNMTGPR